MGKPQLSVVIPAYNEENVIASTVQAVAGYLSAKGMTYEILVVDDGSSDHTVAIVQQLAMRVPNLKVLQSDHRGKGGAVKHGVLQARGELIVFLDADHSTRIEEWEKCAPWLREGYDVVIGSRKMSGAMVTVHQPPLREALGKVFTWLTNVLLAAQVSDVTCGFKCFQSAAARELFTLQRLDGWGFDAEMLFLARRLGLRIKEVPVVWADDASTKVRLASDALGSLRELASIRLGAWRGWYPVHRPVREVERP